VILNASGHGRRRLDRYVSLAEIVIREIERDRSLKVFQLFAERIG
jgi:hypothetical protein